MFVCSTQLLRYQRLHIFGTEGRIDIEIPVNAPPGEVTRIQLEHGGGRETIELEACDQYTLQGDVAARIFMGEIAAAYPLEDAIRNMRVLDALFRSAETGAWQEV